MSGSDDRYMHPAGPVPKDTAGAKADTRQRDTLARLRSALLEQRLGLMETADQSTGTDPYNSGIHPALVKGHDWGKRSR